VGQHRKRFFHYCVFTRCRGNNVSTELFPRNGCYNVACLHNCYLAIGIHVTILYVTTCFGPFGHHQVIYVSTSAIVFLLFSPYIGLCLQLGVILCCYACYISNKRNQRHYPQYHYDENKINTNFNTTFKV
jgi:hypothetical protein